MNKAYSWLSCPVLSVCVAGQGLGKCWGVSFTPSPCAEWKSWTMKQRDELWVSRKGVRIILRQMAHLGPEATLAVYVSHWGHVIHIRTWCPRSESVSVRCTPSAVPEHSCRHAWDPVYNPLTNLRSHMAPVWWSSHSLYAYIYIYIAWQAKLCMNCIVWNHTFERAGFNRLSFKLFLHVIGHIND